MLRLFPLLLGLCMATTPLSAQPSAPPGPGPSAATAIQPANGAPGSELLLLFVRADAADALQQQSAFMRTPGYTIFKQTGPLVRKDGPVLFALFPSASSSPASAPESDSEPASADVMKAASSYLAQRGANRLELEPVINFGADASPEPAVRGEAPAPAVAVSGDSIAQGDWQFTGDRGLLLLFVKAGREPLFRSVLETLRSTLEKSPDARRREQARGWRVMKVNGNGPSGTILYLSVLDPVVHGVNYAPSSIFSEALDGEALARAYSDYADALSSFNLIDLQQVGP